MVSQYYYNSGKRYHALWKKDVLIKRTHEYGIINIHQASLMEFCIYKLKQFFSITKLNDGEDKN